MTTLIDVHGHIVLEGTMGAAGPVCGPELGAYEDGTTWFRVGDWRLDGVPYRESLFMQVGLRLEAMDEAGIGLQALSPNPLTYLHWIPAPAPGNAIVDGLFQDWSALTFADVLLAVRHAQLDGEIATSEQALTMARKQLA